MLAVWGAVVVVSLGLTGTLLGSGLTSESSLTNHPESDQAQKLIDARLPQGNAIDEVIVMRSERLVVSDPAFAARVQTLVARARRSAAVQADLQLPGPGRRDPGLGRPPRHIAAGRGRRAQGRADRST